MAFLYIYLHYKQNKLHSEYKINLEPQFGPCKFLDFFSHRLPGKYRFNTTTFNIVLVNNLTYNRAKLPRRKIDLANKAFLRRTRGRGKPIWDPCKTTRVLRIIDSAEVTSYLYLFRSATARGCLVEADLCPPLCLAGLNDINF